MPAFATPFVAPFRKRRSRSRTGSTILPTPSAPATPNTPSPTNAGTALYTLLSWLSDRQARADVYLSTSATAVSYKAAVLADSPVAYWRLGEVQGTTALDEIANAHPGTYVNGPTLGQGGLISDGDLSVLFTAASTQYVTMGDSTAFEFAGALTVEAVVKYTSSAILAIAGKLSGGPSGYLIYSNTGQIQAVGYGPGLTQIWYVQNPATSNDGLPHHVAVTFDGTTNANGVKLYDNGVLVAQTTSTGTAVGDAGIVPFTIGSDQTNADPFNGTIDEVAIYGSSLTGTQIANHYAQRLAAPPVAVHNVGMSYVPTLNPSSTYYWQVIAINDGGQTAGPIWSFSTLAATEPIFMLDGVRSSTVLWHSVSIRDILNAAANTARATFRSVVTVGQQIMIGLGTLDPGRLIFAGEIQQPDQTYVGKSATANTMYPISAVDYTFELNRRRPFGTYVNQSATTIALSWIAKFALGFTGNGVESGLPVVSITCDGSEDFGTAFSRLATMIRGYYGGPDYSRDVRLFLTETSDAPDPLDSTPGRFLNDPPLSVSTDSSQMRNQVDGKGHGETVPTDVAAGETILPIADAIMFNPAGGQAIAGVTSDGAQGQILSYVGVQIGGGGSLVGPGVAPSVAPAHAFGSGTGVEDGVHKYAYTWVTGSGETTPSPLDSATVAPLEVPTSPLTATATAGAEIDLGTHSYACTFVTAVGETRVGVATFFTSNAGFQRANLTNIPTGLAGVVIARNIYRTASGGGFKKFVTTINDNTTTTYTDLTTDAGLGAQEPATNTAAMNQVSVSGVAIGPTGTTQRKLYRTATGAAQLKLQQTIANNTATTAVLDVTPDASLGANAPTGDTSGLTIVTGQVNAGSTTLITAGAAGFAPNGGWAIVHGGEYLRYTSISGNTLTGIPATGIGAIVNTVLYNDPIVAAAALTGINVYNGTPLAMAMGSAVHLWVQRNDLASQAIYGIHEHLISDERLGETLLTATCDADLAIFSRPIVTLKYDTHDPKTRSGKTIHVDLPAPVSLTGDFVIQEVGITFEAPNLYPRYSVTASSVRFSFEDVLRKVLLAS